MPTDVLIGAYFESAATPVPRTGAGWPEGSMMVRICEQAPQCPPPLNGWLFRIDPGARRIIVLDLPAENPHHAHAPEGCPIVG